MKWIGLAIWLALPVFLLLLPADYFDHGAAICPSKVFLDMECFGCGLTRAVQHAIHFEFKTAFAFNRGIIWIFPFGIMVYIHVLGRFLSKDYFPFLKKLY